MRSWIKYMREDIYCYTGAQSFLGVGSLANKLCFHFFFFSVIRTRSALENENPGKQILYGFLAVMKCHVTFSK